MNVTLYELSEDYRQALEILADPELPPEAVADTLEGMIGTLENKATNIAMSSGIWRPLRLPSRRLRRLWLNEGRRWKPESHGLRAI